jgi:hypothetical protein
MYIYIYIYESYKSVYIYTHIYLPAAKRVANIGSVDRMMDTSVAATSSNA